MSALTLGQVKEWLRYDASDLSNDDTLSLVFAGAQRWIENRTGHLLTVRAVEENPIAFPVAPAGQTAWIDLRWKPADAETVSIAYLDSNLAAAEFTDFTAYRVNGTTRLVANTGTQWPAGSGIAIGYSAGYAEGAVPDDLLHAMLLYCGISDEDRANPGAAGWAALENLLTHYRVPVLA